MNILGKHLILDVWLHEDVTESVVRSILSVIRSRLNVVGESFHVFEPQGLTHVCILSESHFTLHTYPEHRYLSMDLYICNEGFDLCLLEQEILRQLKVSQSRSEILLRGRSHSAERKVARDRGWSEMPWT